MALPATVNAWPHPLYRLATAGAGTIAVVYPPWELLVWSPQPGILFSQIVPTVDKITPALRQL